MGITIPTGEAVQQCSVPTGTLSQLSFAGNVWRLVPPYGGFLALPKITAGTVGVPLYVAKTVGSGLVRTVARGLGSDGVTAARINGSPSGYPRQAAGLQVMLHDGSNWWST